MNGTASADGQPGFVELQLLRHGPPHKGAVILRVQIKRFLIDLGRVDALAAD